MGGNGWRAMTLGQFVTLQRGHDLPEQERHPGKVPILGSFGITGFHNTACAKGPGVTVGRSGESFGVVNYSPVDYWPLNTALYVKDFHGNDERFAYYFLKTIDFKRYNSGSAQPSLNRNYVHPIPVEIPSFAEQQAIAHILGTLDDKIELNRRMNETLEAMARAIFKSWFVDFDPVRAKAEGRNPGLPKPVADLFPDRFEESELGIIPKGWRPTKLNETCTVGRGSSPRPIHNYMGGTVPWIKIADATSAGGPFIYDTAEFVTEQGAKRSVWVNPGDLILSNSATCGVPIFVGLRGCIHDGWLHFSQLQKVSRGYLFHWLASISDHLIHIADGSVQKNLNTSLVGNQVLTIPPPRLLSLFDKMNDAVFTQIDRTIRQSRTLAKLRDTLLPKLLSGEIELAVKGDAC